MSIYGQSIIKTTNTSNLRGGGIPLYESVVFEEYKNYKSMMENCSDPSERELLSEKVDLLLEVSFKDIGNAIMKVIKKIKEAIKNAFEWLKGIFKSKKFKMMEKQCKDLEEELKKEKMMNVELKAENAARVSKSQYDDKADEAKRYYADYESEKIRANTREAERDYYKDKKEKLEAKLAEVGTKIASNNLLYFDMYDYLKKDINPAKLVRSNSFDFISRFGLQVDKNIREKDIDKIDELIKELDKYNIILPEVMKYVGYTKHGGYDHREMHNYIRESISKKPRYTDMKELMDTVKWLSRGYQVSTSIEIINEYQKVIAKVEEACNKMFATDIRTRKNDEELMERGPEGAEKVLRSYISLINDNVRLISVLSNYAGRACGAASQALISLSLIMGLEED